MFRNQIEIRDKLALMLECLRWLRAELVFASVSASFATGVFLFPG